MLRQKSSVVVSNAYAIVCMISIYEELQELIELMNAETLKGLIGTPNLLHFFYSGWLEVEDSFMDELKDCMISQIPIIREYERRTKVGYETISKHSKIG